MGFLNFDIMIWNRKNNLALYQDRALLHRYHMAGVNVHYLEDEWYFVSVRNVFIFVQLLQWLEITTRRIRTVKVTVSLYY